MRRFLVLLAIMGSVFVSSGAAAQETATPEKIALVKRYYEAIDFDQMFSTMFDSMGPAMLEQMKARDPGLDEARTKRLLQITNEAMSQYMSQMIEQSAEIYAEVYTQAELEYLVAFYEDPRGKAIIDKMPIVMPKATKVAMDLMPEFQAKLEKRMCEVVDCKNADPVQP